MIYEDSDYHLKRALARNREIATVHIPRLRQRAVLRRQHNDDLLAEARRMDEAEANDRATRRLRRQIRKTRPHLHFDPAVTLANPHEDWFSAEALAA